MDVCKVDQVVSGHNPLHSDPKNAHWKVRPGLFVTILHGCNVVLVDNILSEEHDADTLDHLDSLLTEHIARRSPLY